MGSTARANNDGDGARATAVLRELRFLAKVAEDVGAMAAALDA